MINNAFKLLSRGLGRRKMSYEVEKEKKHTISHSIFNRMEIHYDVIITFVTIRLLCKRSRSTIITC